MKVTVKGNKVIVEIEVDGSRRLSSSGKTMLVDDGTDRQKIKVGDETITVAVNTYAPIKTA